MIPMKLACGTLARVGLLVACCGVASAIAQERMITKQVLVKAPVEAVWEAWTTTEGIKTFFAPDARVEARPDGPFEIYFNPYAAPGAKGGDGLRILALQPQRMISFTWNAPPYFPEVRPHRTYVTVRMHPAADGQTHVTLAHSGWGDGGQWDQVYNYFDKSWGIVLANLQKRFVEGPIDWKPFLESLKAAEKK
jgi:uncharacterized protein YndB with AHSA1/START domain